ncbi:helix-turn-helix transcriptional regulator [Micromonospora sp. WMMD1076]|uniref:helix-turn-helix domain-containing protein n=1 Tax=Micromonospora sp. WMMD1076 TaxID=3016103 RepID=UPI00249B9C59|nr:helix-turn-helix transcriptional regulator [Micromonospora sp. WMMD1076]WFF08062.1 helix-turn-helix transcriptional regulator [Micromonospora sp. WMMD1076]
MNKTSRPVPRPRRVPTEVPPKIAPKQFKPIPDDAPAKELGEFLRAMIRNTNLSLDRIAAAGGMSKNTLTTTMDGRSKGRESIDNWINAYSKAVGAPPYTRQVDEINRLYALGQQNHHAGRRRTRPAVGAMPSTTTTPAATTAAAMAAGEVLPSPASLLVEICIELPRRTPGGGIDPHAERFLEQDEIDEKIAAIKWQALQGPVHQMPVQTSTVANPWFASPAHGPWNTVHLSANAELTPTPFRANHVPYPPVDQFEPTTGAPTGGPVFPYAGDTWNATPSGNDGIERPETA